MQIEDYFPAASIFGDRLQVEDLDSEVVQQHLHLLSRIPDRLHRRLAAAGLQGILVGNKTVLQFKGMEKLKDQQPRGWPDGSTWNDVPGGYEPNERRLILGGGAEHGSKGLALHEYGHAVDFLLGNLSATEAFRNFHKDFYDLLSPHEALGGPGDVAGCQEFFAESFAQLILEGSESLEARYHPDYARFMEELLS